MARVYHDSGEILRDFRVSKARYGGRRVIDQVLAGEHQAVSYKTRLIFYVLATTLFMYLLVTLVEFKEAELLFAENGVLEWMQISMLLLCSVLLLSSAWYMSGIRESTYLLAFLPLIACVRELDNILDVYLFDGSWQMIVLTMFVYMVYFLRLHWQDIKHQITRILAIPPTGLLFAGFLTVIVFSRIFGQQTFWQFALQENYQRLVARIAEESCEIFGYLILVFGCIELLIFTISCQSTAAKQKHHTWMKSV